VLPYLQEALDASSSSSEFIFPRPDGEPWDRSNADHLCD
jgi:hypothetical protein